MKTPAATPMPTVRIPAGTSHQRLRGAAGWASLIELICMAEIAPLVGLFGPTDPARTGPLGYGRVLRQPLPCSPCLQRRCQIAETRRCMRDLGVKDVLAAARELLATAAREA